MEKTPKFEVVEGTKEKLGRVLTEVLKSLPDDFYELSDRDRVEELRKEMMEFGNDELLSILEKDNRFEDVEQTSRTCAAIEVVRSRVIPAV